MPRPTATGARCLFGYSGAPCCAPNGNILGAVIAFREIGPLVACQQERARAEQLAANGLAAAGLAREVRNSLAGLRSTAQGLAMLAQR